MFKHHGSCRPVCLQISPQSSNHKCPVRAMVRYLEVRGNSQGPLFTFDGLSPIHQSFYISQLKNVISFVGLDCKNYKSHSFRIGAASYAFLCKISEDQIRLMGRWNSSAVKRYFRIPVFNAIDVSPEVILSEAADKVWIVTILKYLYMLSDCLSYIFLLSLIICKGQHLVLMKDQEFMFVYELRYCGRCSLKVTVWGSILKYGIIAFGKIFQRTYECAYLLVLVHV